MEKRKRKEKYTKNYICAAISRRIDLHDVVPLNTIRQVKEKFMYIIRLLIYCEVMRKLVKKINSATIVYSTEYIIMT